VIVFPETVLLPLILPDESRYVVDPVEDVDAVPLIRPWASLKVVNEPEPLDVHAIRPCASLNVVLPVLDCEADPETLPCESLKVVVFPDVLVVVEILPVPSLSIAFLPIRIEAGSVANARTGKSRERRSSFIGLWTVMGAVYSLDD